ncbi:GSCOCG00011174001-RA-CDS [Cotesia congregata]|nr:GSCOCG00011174001-RA-CDS [Cotesia congregata]
MRLTSNSVGPDNFPIKAYKCLISFVLPFVTLLFSNSLNSGVFPNEWKLSRIVPIPKRTNAEICADYRPISLTSNLSKALERCVHDQIIKYVTENNFIDEYQMSSREGLNTQTAVINLCDDIRSAINASEVTVAVFFDLSKAFDSVNHKRLLQKLLSMNFSTDSIKWIRSYLTQRKQQVFANECASSWRNVLNGVQQGSVLGPLLFSLYISDLSQQLSCRYLLYADDLVIYLPCHPEQINDCVAALNAEIVKIVEWCNINYLKLNASKTKAVIFGIKVKINCNNCKYADCIRVNDCVIHYDTTIKYLGVLIDSTLTWENQVMSVCNRAMRVLAQLKINNEIFNEKLRIKLVTTLIFPVFDYCCAAY